MNKALIISAVVVLGLWYLHKKGKTLSVSIEDNEEQENDSNNDDNSSQVATNEGMQIENEFTEKYGLPFRY